MQDTKQSGCISRRKALKVLGAAGAAGALAQPAMAAEKAGAWDPVAEFFQTHFREMTPEEKQETVARFERKYSKQFGKDVTVSAKDAIPGVKFVYMLDIGRCIGCRRCVYGCVKENNQSRPSDHSSQIQYIRVVKHEGVDPLDFDDVEHYYEEELVPQRPGTYVPVQCQQCDKPPCVQACPVQATWKDKGDGVVQIDYNWCIGCRFCMAACPYQARRFNWGKPNLPAEEMNPVTHYLGNRPRMKGVVEKCHFCMQRTREGLYPACHEVCPTGVRKFGNILDPNSEVSQVMKRYKVFRLKEDLGTEPSFFYYSSTK